MAVRVRGEPVIAAPRPRVSVVIRSYNRGERLLRAIDSALAQTFEDREILVVDDASEDGSAEAVAQRYGDAVRLVALNSNLGAAGAANVGVGEARGRYVAFLDSDDEWMPRFLELSLAALETHPASVLSYCDYVRVFDEYELEQPMRSWRSVAQRRDILKGGFIHTMSLTVTLRDAIISAGGFDDEYAISHDFDLWLRLALAIREPFVHVAAPLVRHRISVDGVTAQSQRWLEEYRDALARGFRHPAAKPYQDELDEAQRRVAVGIVARRQVARWVREPAERSVTAVILAAAGGDGDLRAALDCVREQSVAELEAVIVCDDPGLGAVLDDIEAEEDPRVRIARFDAPRSRGRLINAGINAGSGELVAFLDAGDRWHPDYLRCQLRAQSVLLPTPVFTFAALDATPGAPETGVWPVRSSDLMAHALLEDFAGRLSAMVVSRTRLLDVEGADEQLATGVDRNLMLRLMTRMDGEDRPSAQAAPPVFIARRLVGAAPPDAAAAELARVYGTDPFRAIWRTPAGQEYVFLRNEAVSRFMDRGF